mgnify:CR=1 FL=1
MRFINRLCIFLLGVVMGIVGCVGGLAGGVYYAYTGLSVEDFTGTLTKEDVPVLDDSAERNITQMTMEEISGICRSISYSRMKNPVTKLCLT